MAADLAGREVAANVELDGDGRSASLRYRNADVAIVSTALAEHGVAAVLYPDKHARSHLTGVDRPAAIADARASGPSVCLVSGSASAHNSACSR